MPAVHHTCLPGLGCVFLSMLSRAEWFLLQAEDFRSPVLSGRSCENASTHRSFGGVERYVQGALLNVADTVSALPVSPALSTPIPPSCSHHQHPPQPWLPGARVSQGSRKCQTQHPPSRPTPDPDGRINSPGSGLSDGTARIYVLHHHCPQNFLCGRRQPTSVLGNVAATSHLCSLSS